VNEKRLEFQGKYYVNTTLEIAWPKFFDPETIKKLFPYVKSLQVLGRGAYFLTMKMPVWGLPGDIWMRVDTLDVAEKKRVVYRGVGSGVGTSFTIELVLTFNEVANGFEVLWKADLKLSGRILSLPEKVIEKTSKRIIDKVGRNLGELARGG
jgi:carbon monoxide dehydrogenase subunit G